MKTEIKHESTCSTISVTGSVDALTAAELGKNIDALVAGQHTNLIVDLSGLDFMSSAGLRTLLGAVKETRSQGGDLRIVSTNSGIDKVLKMSGFHNIAKVFTTVADAVASFE